ncbi:MAG TPA: hypothetical protein VMW52_12800 [Phycisphaerae bacterium]|nr:hypothetical protein [Phycisphaerae bacterium]
MKTRTWGLLAVLSVMPAAGAGAEPEDLKVLQAENRMLRASVKGLREKLAGMERELAALRAENEKLRRAPPATQPATQPAEIPAAAIGFAELTAAARSFVQQPPPERTAAAEAARREAIVAGLRGRRLTMEAALENVGRRDAAAGETLVYEATLRYRSKGTVQINRWTGGSGFGGLSTKVTIPAEEISIRAWPVGAAAVDLPRGGKVRVSGVIDKLQIGGSAVAGQKGHWSIDLALTGPIVLESGSPPSRGGRPRGERRDRQ